MSTIADWERDRFQNETEQDIANLPITHFTPIAASEPEDRPELIALAGRVTAGLSVQLLVTPGPDPDAFVTVATNGRTETFQIDPRDALAAYRHPYVYGATLPLR